MTTTATTTLTATPTVAVRQSPRDDGPDRRYHSLVIDSGAIIGGSALLSSSSSSSALGLLDRAESYFTVPGVLLEIRDVESRRRLGEFESRLASLRDGAVLNVRSPSKEAMRAVSDFARKTGDYAALSGVDLQVLALLYDLEGEANGGGGGGCGAAAGRHVRRVPRGWHGRDAAAAAADGSTRAGGATGGERPSGGDGDDGEDGGFGGGDDGVVDPSLVDYDDDDHPDDDDDDGRATTVADAGTASRGAGLTSWALIVDPTRASTIPPVDYNIATTGGGGGGGATDGGGGTEAKAECGQFDDASSSSSSSSSSSFDDDDDDGEDEAIDVANANSDDELPSDEECDVYVLEPHEAVYFQRLREEKERRASENCAALRGTREKEKAIDDESGSDFLSPADDGGGGEFERLSDAGRCHGTSSDWRREEEERKRRALLPMVNGRPAVVASYNSFRRYRDVVSAGGSAKAAIEKRREEEEGLEGEGGGTSTPSSSAGKTAGGEDGRPDDVYKSRILGAALAQSDPAGFSSEMTAEDDDGEGWVTCARDIIAMKATGSLDPAVGPSSSSALRDDRRRSDADAGARDRKIFGPPIHQRAACATTDFAMQNVILQMNLELVAVDGARVRRLKTWVARCGACFTVYAGDKQEKAGGRLFCDRCGSNMMQRIACSVDRGTGRLKLHMKRNYRVNTRGTKFSLPKPGKGNKYEGDLLLAEDQLLYGAWNQKVRMGKSKSSGQSIFGCDLASDLGCIADLTKRDDIKVGFGRRNPNSTKFGRERRGKKKKNVTEKACGLRRY